jgi:hypothetical protein
VPDQRRTHVKRFLAKTRGDDGEIVDVQGVWLDVQRRETMQMEEGSGFEYQQTIVELQHYDDESGEQPNKARVSHILKVVPPDEDDPDNPSLWWEIEVSDEITVRDADVEIKRRFDNSKNNETRREHVELRRVSHSDTPYDDDPKYDNGGIIQGYEKTPDTKDEGQYLDVEIIRNFSFDEFQPNKRLTPPWEFSQRTDVKLNNDDLIEDSDPIPADQNYEDDDINPPYRLDPFQNIVNMQYSPPERPVIGRSLYVGTGGDATSFTEVSNDKGESWETGFGDRTSTAASGLGLTVAGKGKHVVFGKPKDGAPCFIRATIFDFGDPDHPDQKIQRGVSDGDGGLKWSTVATVPADGRVVGLSFAGKAFFVAYQDSDEKAFALVSFNGENFAKVRTFSNVPSDNSQFQDRGNNPDAEAQSVAYDPVNKRYCTTGQFLRWYSFNIADPSDDPFIDTIPDTNFMWATSSDGVKWSAGYDTSQCVGAINDPPRDKSGIYCDPLYNSVAWGAGLFVAATAQKVQYTQDAQFGSVRYQFYLKCSVATSTDGQRWTNTVLPGAIGQPSAPPLTKYDGISTGVVFVKTAGTDKNGNPKGFFVVTGLETRFFANPDDNVQRSKVWTSPDGLSWTMVRDRDSAGDSGTIDALLSVVSKNKPAPGKLLLV